MSAAANPCPRRPRSPLSPRCARGKAVSVFLSVPLINLGRGACGARPAAPSGHRWPPSRPDAAHPGYIAGRYYPIFGGNTATNNISANLIYMMPFIPEFDISVQDVGTYLVVGAGATNAKAAIYANKYSGTGKARAFGAPLAQDNTGQATTASAAAVTFPVATALKKGIAYWCGMKVDSGTPTFTCAGTTSLNGARLIGKSAVNGSNMVAVTTPHTFATAWPTFDGSETWTDANTMPVLNLKA